MAAIEAKLDALLSKDAELSRLHGLMTSVGGVGKCIAAQVIVDTDGFKNIKEGKGYAYYSGVAPFEHSSVSSVGSCSRVSHQANKGSKILFHLAAIGAYLYGRQAEDLPSTASSAGKHKMSVMTSMRNQLILRVFACVPDNRVYQNYVHAIA